MCCVHCSPLLRPCSADKASRPRLMPLLASLLPLVDHHVGLRDADELGHCLLHVQVLDLVPLLRRLAISTLGNTAIDTSHE